MTRCGHACAYQLCHPDHWEMTSYWCPECGSLTTVEHDKGEGLLNPVTRAEYPPVKRENGSDIPTPGAWWAEPSNAEVKERKG